jgi:hypothetical protein
MVNPTDKQSDIVAELRALGNLQANAGRRQTIDRAADELERLRALLPDCYARLHDHYREGGGGYMEPPSPADEWSYGIIPLFVAIQNATGKNHNELLTAGNSALSHSATKETPK